MLDTMLQENRLKSIHLYNMIWHKIQGTFPLGMSQCALDTGANCQLCSSHTIPKNTKDHK